MSIFLKTFANISRSDLNILDELTNTLDILGCPYIEKVLDSFSENNVDFTNVNEWIRVLMSQISFSCKQIVIQSILDNVNISEDDVVKTTNNLTELIDQQFSTDDIFINCLDSHYNNYCAMIDFDVILDTNEIAEQFFDDFDLYVWECPESGIQYIVRKISDFDEFGEADFDIMIDNEFGGGALYLQEDEYRKILSV